MGSVVSFLAYLESPNSIFVKNPKNCRIICLAFGGTSVKVGTVTKFLNFKAFRMRCSIAENLSGLDGSMFNLSRVSYRSFNGKSRIDRF